MMTLFAWVGLLEERAGGDDCCTDTVYLVMLGNSVLNKEEVYGLNASIEEVRISQFIPPK